MNKTKIHALSSITKKLTISSLLKLIRTPESKKAIVLYLAQLLGIIFSFATQKMNTNHLSDPHEYGMVTASLAIFTFMYVFFEFGIFASGARLLAKCKTEIETRKMYGTLFVFVFFIAALFSIMMTIGSAFLPFVYSSEQIRQIMTLVSLLAWVYPLQFFFQETSQGSGKIYQLSIYTVLAKFLYTASLGVTILFCTVNATISLLLNLGAMGLSGMVAVYLLRPTFNGWKLNIPALKTEIRQYGWHIYIGRVLASPAFNLTSVLIPYLNSMASSAFFAVGGSLSAPMVMAAQSISSSLFKNFSTQKKLKNRLIIINSSILAVLGIGIYFGAPILIHLAASEKYNAALPLMFPLVLAGFFQGFYQPFNLFVSAHGKGVWTKQISIVGTLFDVISSVLMVSLFGLLGACWQTVASRVFWSLIYYYNYRRTIKSLSE